MQNGRQRPKHGNLLPKAERPAAGKAKPKTWAAAGLLLFTLSAATLTSAACAEEPPAPLPVVIEQTATPDPRYYDLATQVVDARNATRVAQEIERELVHQLQVNEINEQLRRMADSPAPPPEWPARAALPTYTPSPTYTPEPEGWPQPTYTPNPFPTPRPTYTPRPPGYRPRSEDAAPGTQLRHPLTGYVAELTREELIETYRSGQFPAEFDPQTSAKPARIRLRPDPHRPAPETPPAVRDREQDDNYIVGIPTATPEPMPVPDPDNTEEVEPEPQLLPGRIAYADLTGVERLHTLHPGTADQIGRLEWVQQGVEPKDADAAEALIFLALAQSTGRYEGRLYSLIKDRDWLTTNQQPEGRNQVILGLHQLGYSLVSHRRGYGSAERVAASPFLKGNALDPWDAPAVTALANLEQHFPSAFRELMAHPRLNQNITDELAKLLPTLYNTAYAAQKPGAHPPVTRILEDRNPVLVLTRDMEQSKDGNPEDCNTYSELCLIIIVSGPTQPGEAAHGMELAAEEAVESSAFLRKWLAQPPLRRSIVIHYSDEPTASGEEVYNNGLTVNLRMEELPQYPSDVEKRRTLTRALAQHWWADSGPEWVDAGMARVLAEFNQLNQTRARRLVLHALPACALRSLQELSAAAPVHGEDDFDCYATLGARFFRELHEDRPEEPEIFQNRLRRLWEKAKQEPINLDDLKDAFYPDLIDAAYRGR